MKTPSGIELGPLNMWCYNKPLWSLMTRRPPHKKWSFTPTTPQPQLYCHYKDQYVIKVPMVTLVSIVPNARGVCSPAPLILCPMNIIPRVGRTGISITLIPLRLAFRLYENTNVILSIPKTMLCMIDNISHNISLYSLHSVWIREIYENFLWSIVRPTYHCYGSE